MHPLCTRWHQRKLERQEVCEVLWTHLRKKEKPRKGDESETEGEDEAQTRGCSFYQEYGKYTSGEKPSKAEWGVTTTFSGKKKRNPNGAFIMPQYAAFDTKRRIFHETEATRASGKTEKLKKEKKLPT